jgi:hypothetical protein
MYCVRRNRKILSDFHEQSEASGTASSTVSVAPLSQAAPAKRLGCSNKAIEKHRKLGSKESFAKWSCDRDPNSIA